MSVLFFIAFILINTFYQIYFRTFDSETVYQNIAANVLIEEITRVLLIFLILKINPKILIKFALYIILFECLYYIYSELKLEDINIQESVIVLLTKPLHLIATIIYNEKIKLNLLKFLLICIIHYCINVSAYFYFNMGNVSFMYAYIALGILCTIASVKYIYFNKSAKDAPI